MRVLYFYFVLSSIFMTTLSAREDNTSLANTNEVEIIVTPEQKEKYPLKPIHASLSLKCIFCHEGQGNNIEGFKAVREATCLECHGTKEKLAKRLGVIDTIKANPHNSIHDGTRLQCDECHNEHKPSTNMCTECHEKEIQTNMWMGQTP